VSPLLAQRQLALAAATLLAVIVALAVAHETSGHATSAVGAQPEAASPAEWYRALAGAEGGLPRVSTCGLLQSGTLGIAHPVLPCGTKLYLSFHGKIVLTEVVERGPSGADREFDLTPALARRLGLHGVQPIRWSFARS
jgi:hypothetical protein